MSNNDMHWTCTILQVDSSKRAYWLRVLSPPAPCDCCESLTGSAEKLLTEVSLGMRWWPPSSVVFGEAG